MGPKSGLIELENCVCISDAGIGLLTSIKLASPSHVVRKASTVSEPSFVNLGWISFLGLSLDVTGGNGLEIVLLVLEEHSLLVVGTAGVEL